MLFSIKSDPGGSFFGFRISRRYFSFTRFVYSLLQHTCTTVITAVHFSLLQFGVWSTHKRPRYWFPCCKEVCWILFHEMYKYLLAVQFQFQAMRMSLASILIFHSLTDSFILLISHRTTIWGWWNPYLAATKKTLTQDSTHEETVRLQVLFHYFD
jgi:hypothetical protein